MEHLHAIARSAATAANSHENVYTQSTVVLVVSIFSILGSAWMIANYFVSRFKPFCESHLTFGSFSGLCKRLDTSLFCKSNLLQAYIRIFSIPP
jgi:hypothetical protein